MDKKKFIFTQDKTVAENLIAKGIRLISENNGSWTFENMLPKNFSFSEEDKKVIAYTNMLTF